MYYFPQPPILVALFGLFIALTFGSVFQNLTEEKVASWSKNPDIQGAYQLQGSGLQLSYWGIGLGVWVFLAGGFLIFGFGIIPSFGVALPIALFTCSLIWGQLSDVFRQLKQGGIKAIDLDSFG